MGVTVGTNNHCFLCQRVNAPNINSELTFETVNLHAICRFLRIDINTIIPDVTDKQICANFCAECTEVVNSCSSLIRELEMVQLILADKLGTFAKLLKLGNEYENLPGSSSDLAVVSSIKEQLKQKCLKVQKLFTMPQVPLVQLETLPASISSAKHPEDKIFAPENIPPEHEIPTDEPTSIANESDSERCENSTPPTSLFDFTSILKSLQDQHMTAKSLCNICNQNTSRGQLHFFTSHVDMVLSFLRTTDKDTFREICLQVLHLEKVKATKDNSCRCTYCAFTCVDNRPIASHVIVKHLPEIEPKIRQLQTNVSNLRWRCWENRCTKSFATKDERARHLEWEHSNQTKCSYCHQECRQANNLRRHMVCLHPEQLFKHKKPDDQTLEEFRIKIEEYFKTVLENSSKGIGKSKVFFCPYCQNPHGVNGDFKKHLAFSHTEKVEEILATSVESDEEIESMEFGI